MTRQPAQLAMGACLKAWWNFGWQMTDPCAIQPLRMMINCNNTHFVMAKGGAAGIVPPKVNDPALIGLPADARDGDHQIWVSGGCSHVVVQ